MTDSSDSLPPDPLSLLGSGAVQVHELFTSLVKAGFTRNEALWLTATLVTAAARNNSPEPPC